ncbi:hypothetical protein ACFQMA_07575 [Halosimplex aquaticum]|uniref:DUF2231 domain-containing protein n=1 Tax=Halosimplex aquaticum TaxID=3026162 RepID=A0ABD5XXB5_9EURY|nr:hypothetical protein [Halosimplex aquaticum]
MDNSRESNAARIDRTDSWADRWADAEALGTGGDGRSPPFYRRDALSLLAPTALAIVYGLVVLVAGGGVFATGQPLPGAGVAFGLLGALFAVAAHGTLRLYDDARTVARAAGDWRPNPWLYVANAALLLVGLQAVRFAVAGQPVSAPVPTYAGTLVVALPLSSLVAGPVYVAQRYRHA